jgi:hypothetical protein
MVTADNGEVYTANRVILNLPTRPLQRLLSSSNVETVVNSGIYAPEHNRATKLYLYYDNAWWISKGFNNASLSATGAFGPNNVTIPLVARYYDGQVKCATTANSAVAVDYYYTANGLDTNNCYGYFQAVYTSASSGSAAASQAAVAYLTDYMSSDTPDVPYRIIDSSLPKGKKLLQDSHTSIMKWHAQRNITLESTIQNTLPSHAVVALWDQAISWMGGGWHGMKDSTKGTPDAVAMSGVIHPFPGIPLYIANEAYGPSTTQGWSEASLVLAENIIQGYFGGAQAPWMRNTTLTKVIFGPNWDDYESAQQGGGAIVLNTAPPKAAPAMAPSVSASG